jgi:hypothetical protein
MTIQIVRKPPIGKIKTDRLKVTLKGNHTLKQKLCMSMQAIHHLKLEGFVNAGPMDMWIPLIDPFGYELTHFSNGNLIADYHIIVESPYHCAADEHGA